MTDENYDPQAEFAKNLSKIQGEMQSNNVDPATGFRPGQSHQSQRGQPNVDPAKLQAALVLHSETDENGRRLMEYSDSHRKRVDEAYKAAYGEGAQQRAAPSQTAQEPAEAKRGEGSPAERSAAELDADGFTPFNWSDPESMRELTSGYDLSEVLPTGDEWGLGAQDVADLKAARRAGLSQRQVEKIVLERIRGQM